MDANSGEICRRPRPCSQALPGNTLSHGSAVPLLASNVEAEPPLSFVPIGAWDGEKLFPKNRKSTISTTVQMYLLWYNTSHDDSSHHERKSRENRPGRSGPGDAPGRDAPPRLFRHRQDRAVRAGRHDPARPADRRAGGAVKERQKAESRSRK